MSPLSYLPDSTQHACTHICVCFFHNLSTRPPVCFTLSLRSSLPQSAHESKSMFSNNPVHPSQTVDIQNGNYLINIDVWEEKHIQP